jgi:hypothetical protein
MHGNPDQTFSATSLVPCFVGQLPPPATELGAVWDLLLLKPWTNLKEIKGSFTTYHDALDAFVKPPDDIDDSNTLEINDHYLVI